MFIFNFLTTVSDAFRDEENIKRIIQRVKEGDDDAFETIIDRYRKLVWGAVIKTLSSSGISTDLTEEIAQDAFFKAWQCIGSFHGSCTFSTWLYTIAQNAAKDRIRAEARHAAHSLILDDDTGESREWDVPVTSGDTIPEEAAERRETILAVRRAIEELPEDQRRVIVLRDLNDLSYAEIAETLGIEIGTVKSRLSRGRESLKKILQKGNFM